MILTTLIFSISGYTNKINDQEIIRRAEKLGMVMKSTKETNSNLDQLLEHNGDDKTKPTQNPTPELTAAPSPTAEPTTELTETPSSGQDSGSSEQAPNPSEKISFTISEGMSSWKVTQILADLGLVEDADDFNDYLVKLKKTGAIRVGTFKVIKGSSYEELMKLITE